MPPRGSAWLYVHLRCTGITLLHCHDCCIVFSSEEVGLGRVLSKFQALAVRSQDLVLRSRTYLHHNPFVVQLLQKPGNITGIDFDRHEEID